MPIASWLRPQRRHQPEDPTGMRSGPSQPHRPRVAMVGHTRGYAPFPKPVMPGRLAETGQRAIMTGRPQSPVNRRS